MQLSALELCEAQMRASAAFHAANAGRLDQLGREVRASVLAGADDRSARLRYLNGQLVMYRDMLGVTLKALRQYKSQHGHTTAGQWVDVRYYKQQCKRLMLQIMEARQVALRAVA